MMLKIEEEKNANEKNVSKAFSNNVVDTFVVDASATD